MNIATPPAKVVRDKNWVEREYNREKYPIVLEAARAAIAGGERDFARLVGQVIAAERGRMAATSRREAVFDGKLASLPSPLVSTGLQGFVSQIIADMCGPQTRAIIELGAGWGRNLFSLHISGLAPAHAAYYALEIAASARETGALVAGHAQNLAFEALPFDYHAPDYAQLPATDAPCVVGTIHSIEQIPLLRREVFVDLIARMPRLSGVHLEPVGFQLPADRRIGITPRSAAAYAETHDYNRNLWAMLEDLERRGLIEIVDIMPEVTGLNPKNASTLIRWRTRCAKDA